MQKQGGQEVIGLLHSDSPFAFSSPKPPKTEELNIFLLSLYFRQRCETWGKGSLQKHCLGGTSGAWTLDFSPWFHHHLRFSDDFG